MALATTGPITGDVDSSSKRATLLHVKQRDEGCFCSQHVPGWPCPYGLSMGCSHGPRSSPTPVHAGPRSVSVHRESPLGRRDWVAHCSVSIASVRNSGSACFSVLQVLKLHLPPVRLKSLYSHSPTALPTNHYLSLGCAEKSRVNTTLATSRWPFDLP